MEVLRGRINLAPDVKWILGIFPAVSGLKRYVVQSLDDVLTKDNFQQFNKICISFKLRLLQTECVQYYEKMCKRLTNNVEASLTDAQFLFNQAAYVMKEAWGSREQFITPLKLKLVSMPALRRALLDAYIDHHHTHDWVMSELIATLVERDSCDDVVHLYTWFAELIQSRDCQPLTLGERSLLRDETLAFCLIYSSATYERLIKTLTEKAIDIDLRFVMLKITKVSKTLSDVVQKATGEVNALSTAVLVHSFIRDKS